MYWGFPPAPSYKEGDIVYRKSDDVKMTIADAYTHGGKDGTGPKVDHYKLETDSGQYCWVKLEELERDYSKEEPYAKQKAKASKDGFVWRDKPV